MYKIDDCSWHILVTNLFWEGFPRYGETDKDPSEMPWYVGPKSAFQRSIHESEQYNYKALYSLNISYHLWWWSIIRIYTSLFFHGYVFPPPLPRFYFVRCWWSYPLGSDRIPAPWYIWKKQKKLIGPVTVHRPRTGLYCDSSAVIGKGQKVWRTLSEFLASCIDEKWQIRVINKSIFVVLFFRIQI